MVNENELIIDRIYYLIILFDNNIFLCAKKYKGKSEENYLMFYPRKINFNHDVSLTINENIILENKFEYYIFNNKEECRNRFNRFINDNKNLKIIEGI